MKVVIAVVATLIAAAVAAPVEEKRVFAIIKSAFDQVGDGGYVYGFETENGITRNENGDIKLLKDAEGKDQSVVVVRGSYSYPDENGKILTVNYIADENGYQAESDIIPKSK